MAEINTLLQKIVVDLVFLLPLLQDLQCVSHHEILQKHGKTGFTACSFLHATPNVEHFIYYNISILYYIHQLNQINQASTMQYLL